MWRITLMYLMFALRCVAGEAELPSSTKATMEAFTKSSDKITQDYNKALADTRTKTVAALTKILEAETKKGNLEGALAIKKKMEELNALNDEGTDLLGAGKGIVDNSKVNLFVSGCDGLELRINGTKILVADRNALSAASTTVKVGDIITIRNGSRHDVNSNFVLATTADGVPMFWINKTWMSYVPPDLVNWSDVAEKKFITKLSEQSGMREYADMVMRAAAGATGWRKDMVAVSGTIMAEDKATYLVYRVTAQDLVPKK